MDNGTHRAHAIDSVLGMTGTGKEQIAVMFEIEETSERITWYGYFTDGTFERTIESLRYLGWTGSDLAVFGKGLPDECGKIVEIVVEEEEGQDGKFRQKVRWINGGGGIAVKEKLDEAHARSFAARMKGKIAALAAAKGTPVESSKPKPAAKPKAAPVNAGGQALAQDDIPF